MRMLKNTTRLHRCVAMDHSSEISHDNRVNFQWTFPIKTLVDSPMSHSVSIIKISIFIPIEYKIINSRHDYSFDSP